MGAGTISIAYRRKVVAWLDPQCNNAAVRNLAKLGGLIAVVGGISWLIKVPLVFSRGPDLLIVFFYFGGLLGPVGAGLATAGALFRRRTLILQVLAGIVLALAFVVLTFATQDLMEIPFRGAFSEFVFTEIPLLIQGLIWAVVGLIMWRREVGRARLSEAPS